MGALTSAIGDVTSAVSAVKTVASLVTDPASLNPLNTSANLLQKQQDLAMKQLQANQDAETAAQTANANIEKQELAVQNGAASQSRADTLNRAIASQRADAAASGLAPDDGSAAAVQQGLFDTADDAQDDADQLTMLKQASIDQGLATRAARTSSPARNWRSNRSCKRLRRVTKRHNHVHCERSEAIQSPMMRLWIASLRSQ